MLEQSPLAQRSYRVSWNVSLGSKFESNTHTMMVWWFRKPIFFLPRWERKLVWRLVRNNRDGERDNGFLHDAVSGCLYRPRTINRVTWYYWILGHLWAANRLRQRQRKAVMFDTVELRLSVCPSPRNSSEDPTLISRSFI